jgi:hypothetical protein
MRAEKHFSSVFYHAEILIDDEIPSYILLKLSNIEFHENSFSASLFFICRYKDLQTNVAKLIWIFLEAFFANKPKRINTAVPVSFYSQFGSHTRIHVIISWCSRHISTNFGYYVYSL